MEMKTLELTPIEYKRIMKERARNEKKAQLRAKKREFIKDLLESNSNYRVDSETRNSETLITIKVNMNFNQDIEDKYKEIEELELDFGIRR